MIWLVKFCEKKKREYINCAVLSATLTTGAHAPNRTIYVYGIGIERKGTIVPKIALFVEKEIDCLLIMLY